MRHRLLVGPAQWWDRAAIVVWWISVDLALRARVSLPVLARFAAVSLDLAAPGRADAAGDATTVDGGPTLLGALSLTERRRLRIVDIVAERWPFGEGPCLRQALVAGRVLRRLHPRLSLGVARRPTGQLVAHAWLELDSGVRLGYSDTYKPMSPLGK